MTVFTRARLDIGDFLELENKMSFIQSCEFGNCSESDLLDPIIHDITNLGKVGIPSTYHSFTVFCDNIIVP
jgi:hypothetical protein